MREVAIVRAVERLRVFLILRRSRIDRKQDLETEEIRSDIESVESKITPRLRADWAEVIVTLEGIIEGSKILDSWAGRLIRRRRWTFECHQYHTRLFQLKKDVVPVMLVMLAYYTVCVVRYRWCNVAPRLSRRRIQGLCSTQCFLSADGNLGYHRIMYYNLTDLLRCWFRRR